MTFTIPLQDLLSCVKGDLLGWKGPVKVTFNLPFLNLKGPISGSVPAGSVPAVFPPLFVAPSLLVP